MKNSHPRGTNPSPQLRSTASFPADGKAVWVRDYDATTGSGKMHLRAQFAGDDITVLAMIQPVGNTDKLPVSVTDPLPAHVVQLEREDTSDKYRILSTPVTGLGPAEPTGNNLQWRVASYGADNQKIDGDTVTPFTAFPSTFTVQVNATCCIWLAYTTDPALPTPNEETIQNNSPKKVLIPDGGWLDEHPVVNVLLEADGRSWQHGPAGDKISTAAGRAGESQAAGVEYAALVNGRFTGDDTINLNALVAVREVDHTTKEALIGRGPTTLSVADPLTQERAKSIFLGMHDGVIWTDNYGFVMVTVTFSRPPSPDA